MGGGSSPFAPPPWGARGQSINKGIESLAQTQMFKPLEPDVVNL